ncbi:abasic site processing protein HMCES [Suncus etruscus]|uniref:abasic site processing protein HMCES n=1 Tax=Suncus etruscus TaxID=109475 RepID=UPI00210F5C92|nr:abasic site processing protein HMCES [Suncus etruscus]
MCGRTSCHLARDALARACAYRDRQGRPRLPEWRDPGGRYAPSYNLSPQALGPVLLSRLHLDPDADSSERVIAPMRWGLIPSWFKEDNPSKLPFNLTNCRSDTMTEKRSFKVPLGKGRRCVVLADGFYEWQRSQLSSRSQPYFIYFPQTKTEKSGNIAAIDRLEDWNKVWDSWRPLTMAGIFECWEPPHGGDCLYSYTVITVDACKGLSDIHPRMPAILDGEEAVSKWLDFGEVSTLEALKLIHPTENIAFHPVSSVVNNSRNNTPECVTPVHLAVKKEPKASGSSQKMLQWLTTKSPKKEDPQKAESDVPQWSSQFLQKSTLPTKRGGAGLLERWLKQEQPLAKRPHSQ